MARVWTIVFLQWSKRATVCDLPLLSALWHSLRKAATWPISYWSPTGKADLRAWLTRDSEWHCLQTVAQLPGAAAVASSSQLLYQFRRQSSGLVGCCENTVLHTAKSRRPHAENLLLLIHLVTRLLRSDLLGDEAGTGDREMKEQFPTLDDDLELVWALQVVLLGVYGLWVHRDQAIWWSSFRLLGFPQSWLTTRYC